MSTPKTTCVKLMLMGKKKTKSSFYLCFLCSKYELKLKHLLKHISRFSLNFIFLIFRTYLDKMQICPSTAVDQIIENLVSNRTPEIAKIIKIVAGSFGICRKHWNQRVVWSMQIVSFKKRHNKTNITIYI